MGKAAPDRPLTVARARTVTGVIAIRPATVDDVPLILTLIRGLAEYERLAQEAVATEEDLRASLFGKQPAAEVLIAELDGRAAGFALFFHNYSTFLGRRGLYLEDLFVFPELRGHGVGRALMARLAHIAVERGCGRFEWWVLDWNRPSIEFYERLGARAMSDWTVYRLTGDALNRLADEWKA
jgi:GNAT superfamily N-acetyltransferase